MSRTDSTWPRRRWAAAGLLVVGAVAVWRCGWPSYAMGGTVYRATSLYPSSPDGWGCHFGGECSPAGLRYAGDPDPVDRLQPGQQVRVRCKFGSPVWAEVEPDRTEIGWIGLDAMSLSGALDSCGAADRALGWRRWG